MNDSLHNLGLTPFFTRQITADEIETTHYARITEVQRSQVTASDGLNDWVVVLGGAWFQVPADQRPTVGDWVLLDQHREKILRLLERKSVFQRLAVGKKVDVQLIAANVDTLFIVTSCNADFNEARLERYLALALEAGAEPVVVITKADMTEQPDSYLARAQEMQPGLAVTLVNAKDSETLASLATWVTKGSTVALVGSSGVGKSTLVNSLSGSEITATGGIREQDGKGRHTTSYRSIHQLASGGLLLDVPGMREVKIAQLDTSLPEVFSDIEDLALQCKFGDCAHEKEPGCAVTKAISNGIIDERRLESYRKLLIEETRQTASLSAQRHRQFSKTVKQHTKMKSKK